MTKNGMSVASAVSLWNHIVSLVGSENISTIYSDWYKLDRPDAIREDIKNLWYDWFCSEDQLVRRGLTLLKRLSRIATSKKFSSEKCYVFFKNNCSISGGLYDDFRIVDDETCDVVYTVNSSQVWGVDNGFEKPIVEGTSSKIRKFFLA